MKVLCINSTYQPNLTNGNFYEVIKECSPWEGIYLIKDNSGRETIYHSDRFITLSEYREQQLDKIGI